MDKKEYKKPQAEAVEIEKYALLAGSETEFSNWNEDETIG